MLYKVSPPNAGPVFSPRKFWRNTDWSSSSTSPHAGYIEETVLYVGGFDEINIHLLPRVRRLRVWLTEATRGRAAALPLTFGPEHRAAIIARTADRTLIEQFAPTIFHFDEADFERVPSNEWIARQPVRAVAQETITMSEAIARWCIALNYVDDLDAILDRIKQAKLKHSEQSV